MTGSRIGLPSGRNPVAIAIAAVCVLVATPEPWTVTSAQVPQFRAGVDLVQLDVSVLDRSGQPVRGLAAADFTVLEDGLPQRLQAFSAVDIPVPVQPTTPWMRDVAPDIRRNDEVLEQRLFVIFFDDLTIPHNPKAIEIAREMARSVINRMGPSDLAAVIFLVSNQHSQEFTNDRSLLLAAANAFTPRAALRELRPDLRVLGTVADSLSTLPQRRKALFFLSVGGESGRLAPPNCRSTSSPRCGCRPAVTACGPPRPVGAWGRAGASSWTSTCRTSRMRRWPSQAWSSTPIPPGRRWAPAAPFYRSCRSCRRHAGISLQQIA